MALDEGDETPLVVDVAFDGGDARPGRDLFGMAGDSGDGMAARRELGEQARAGLSGRADEGDFHDGLQCSMVLIPGIRAIR